MTNATSSECISVEELQREDGWVDMIFADGTRQIVHTTLNKDLLHRNGAIARENAFFDLERQNYVPFRKDAVAIKVYRSRPVFDEEVLQFASRFI